MDTAIDIRASLQHSLFNARCDPDIDEEKRKELLFNELFIIGNTIDAKSIATQRKSTIFRIINVISSWLIIIASGVIIALQALSTCTNIPVIVLSSVIFVVQTTHELMKWGPYGVIYKQGTILLKKIRRQINEIQYTIHKYNSDQLIIILSKLWSSYDDIDLGIYNSTTTDMARYNQADSLTIEKPENNLPLRPDSTRLLTPTYQQNSNPSFIENADRNADRNHIHIHLDSNHSSPRHSFTEIESNPNSNPNSNLPRINEVELEDGVISV